MRSTTRVHNATRSMRIGVVLVALALAACGASTGTATTATPTARTTVAVVASTTTFDKQALGRQVLAILHAGNARIAQEKKLPGTSAFEPISKTFGDVAQQLAALTYPASAQADAKALVAILDKLSFDASQVPSASLATASGLYSVMESDQGTELANSDALRRDLGLPPATP